MRRIKAEKKAGCGSAWLSSQLWWEALKDTVNADLDKKQDPKFKIAGAKRAGGMAQVVKHLPSKNKVLSSNNSTI
jgi:hypothetical protein